MTGRRTDPPLQVLNPRVLVTAAALIVAGCVLGVFAFALWPLVGLRPLWCKAPPLLGGAASGANAYRMTSSAARPDLMTGPWPAGSRPALPRVGQAGAPRRSDRARTR